MMKLNASSAAFADAPGALIMDIKSKIVPCRIRKLSYSCFKNVLKGRKEPFFEVNKLAIERGADFVKNF